MNRDWANLPKELLYLVLERLESPLVFSLVCKAWRSSAKDTQSQYAKTITPMLLISEKKKDIWNLYDVQQNKVLDFQLRLPNKRFCGSSKGWLIVVEDNYAVTLINPFYRVGKRERENSSIRLPPLNPPGQRLFLKQYFVRKATISADPILNADDCIVMVIYEEFNQLAFIRLNKDTKWTYADRSVDKSWRLIHEVALFDGKFYGVDNLGRFFSFDITTESISKENLVKDDFRIATRYLVNSNGKELLMVLRYISYEHGQRLIRLTEKFRVFEFNFNQCDWLEKNNLGDVAIFVGDNSSISIIASKILGCQPNCIYFNHDNDRISRIGRRGPRDFGVYNLEDQSISQPYSMHVKDLLKVTRRPPMWIVPTFKL